MIVGTYVVVHNISPCESTVRHRSESSGLLYEFLERFVFQYVAAL
jgi:hypothetical protein